MDDTGKRRQLDNIYVSGKTTTLDDFFAYTQAGGSVAQAGSNLLYGMNQSKTTGAAPVNNDTQGFVFFTRPMLNLTKANLIRKREMHYLLTTRETSVQRYVRCTLDPSLATFASPVVKSPLVDNKMAFIPLFSNTILKLSGWPDVVAPTYKSKQGLRKEQWALIDGTAEVNESFDMDATFKNTADEPLPMMIDAWVNYATYVFDGQLRPHYGMEVRNEIDYTTRIYRFVMDKDERYIKKVACTVASFPINSQTGKFFDYDRTQQYMSQSKEINVRFTSMGAVYNDDIILKWFNLAAGYANSALREIVVGNFVSPAKNHYEKIPRELLAKFKFAGYPLVNTLTYELEWWIDPMSSTYKHVMNEFNPTTPVPVDAAAVKKTIDKLNTKI
ncbi:MAG: hypothetical protein Q9M11_02555 [Mariprofundaceae bacterium]|nr:hypothetical protein [Mariprofundaceae bacterium]